MNTAEYHIEFDGGQLTIRTDVERVARFVELTYSAMLVPRAFQGVRVVEIHTIAGMRLVDFPGITLRNTDSRKFLSDLAENPDLTGSFTFFYLDAHWYADLPLAEELDLIASRWSRFVVMVDDFQVPGDEGYGYDDYGAGKALTIEYIKPVIAKRNLTARFPAAPAESESGHKRGCVVIAPAGDLTEALASVKSLRA